MKGKIQIASAGFAAVVLAYAPIQAEAERMDRSKLLIGAMGSSRPAPMTVSHCLKHPKTQTLNNFSG